jgi:uncharacterized protein (DUF983 family)
MVAKWFQAMADGLRLRCPHCRKGSMSRTMFDLRSHCPNCGINFQPNAGDFLGTITIAYAVLSVLVISGIFVSMRLTDLSVTSHVTIWTSFSVLFMVLFFRNLKGLWIGILYAMTDLKQI